MSTGRQVNVNNFDRLECQWDYQAGQRPIAGNYRLIEPDDGLLMDCCGRVRPLFFEHKKATEPVA